MAIPLSSRIAIAFTGLILIFSFQQCAPFNGMSADLSSGRLETAASGDMPSEQIGSVVKTCERNDNPANAFVCPSAEQRLANFSARYRGWDFEWNGSNTPADSSRLYHTWFDNPYDDDFEEYRNGPNGVCLIHFDTPTGVDV